MNLVSIIIPTYNYAHYLPETLNSVLNQTFQNWECIIVDDGSTDDTHTVVAQFAQNDSRFFYYYKANGGLSDARNYGIAKSRGEFLLFLDSDDLIAPYFVQLNIEKLEKLPQGSALISSFKRFSTSNNQKQYTEWHQPVLLNSGFQSNMISTLLTNNQFPVSALIIPRAIIEKTGLFNTNLSSLEDWEYWIRATQFAQFYYYPHNDNYTAIRFHADSMSTNPWRMFYNQLRVRQLIKPILEKPEYHRINNLGINSSLKSLLYPLAELIQAGQRGETSYKITEIAYLYPSFKLQILIFSCKFVPSWFYTKMVWLLFEIF